MEHYLSTSVTPPLAATVGSRLMRVNYWCLQWEWNMEEIGSPLFYTGGEVELEFANGTDIYVSCVFDKSVWPTLLIGNGPPSRSPFITLRALPPPFAAVALVSAGSDTTRCPSQ